MASEFTDLAEYVLDEEEQAMVENLLISVEHDPVPHCIESAQNLRRFFGWKKAKNRAIKKYLMEINGPARILEKLKTCDNHEFKLTLIECCWIWCEQNGIGSTGLGPLHDTIIMLYIDEHTLALANAGGIKVAVDLFKSDNDQIWVMTIGWVCGFIEYTPLLEHAANEGLADVVANRLITTTVNEHLFLLAAAAQMCAISESCRTGLLRAVPHIVKLLLDDATWSRGHESTESLLLAIHLATALAHMANDERIWTVTTKQEVFEALDHSITKYTPEAIDVAEISCGYLWGNVAQWIPLMESSIVQVQRVGAFAIGHLAIQANNRETIIKQGLFGRLQMLANSYDPIVVKWATFALDHFKRENIKPVSLQTQAYWHLVKTKGPQIARDVISTKNIGIESIK